VKIITYSSQSLRQRFTREGRGLTEWGRSFTHAGVTHFKTEGISVEAQPLRSRANTLCRPAKRDLLERVLMLRQAWFSVSLAFPRNAKRSVALPRDPQARFVRLTHGVGRSVCL
jgi:hypothetical protein